MQPLKAARENHTILLTSDAIQLLKFLAFLEAIHAETVKESGIPMWVRFNSPNEFQISRKAFFSETRKSLNDFHHHGKFTWCSAGIRCVQIRRMWKSLKNPSRLGWWARRIRCTSDAKQTRETPLPSHKMKIVHKIDLFSWTADRYLDSAARVF